MFVFLRIVLYSYMIFSSVVLLVLCILAALAAFLGMNASKI